MNSRACILQHRGTVRYSCVLAEKPKFSKQVLCWAWSLIEYAKVPAENLHVHVLPGTASETPARLARMGAKLHPIKPFDPHHPYCNKIGQLANPELANADYVVLCDTDLFFLESIESIFDSEAIRAKIVDLPNPPLDQWAKLLDRLGIKMPALHPVSVGDEQTPSVNCNGGLYIIPRFAFSPIAEQWPIWAERVAEHVAVLGPAYRKHVDQISFGLSCLSADISIRHLPISFNFPLHLAHHVSNADPPRVIHYHSHVDDEHFLRKAGRDELDEYISKANELIRDRRAGFT